MPIEFRCPQCQRLLRVPSESAGAKARCPQCSAIVSVPQVGDAGSSEQPGANNPPPRPDANPFAEGAATEQAAARPAGGEPVNPYRAPAGGYEQVNYGPTASGKMVPTQVDAGSIISYAWEIWKANLGILVGVTATVFGITMGLNAVQGVVQAVLEQQGQEAVGAAFAGVTSIIGNLVQVFLGIGQAQIVLKLLRRQRAEYSELFGGGPLFLPVFGASILAGLAVLGGLIACIVPAFLLLIYFWPFYWLLVDRKADIIQSFGMARTFGQANVGTTIVLWLASTGIMLAGFLALCVGIIFAAPLVSLIWGAAYLMMSGQLTPKSPF